MKLNWLSRLLSPKNSLLLLEEPLTSIDFEQWEAGLEEVGKYYRFVSLPELVQQVRQKKARGLAVVAFSHARKNVLLRAVPILKEKQIPFTLFVRSDCVGTNRIPVEDELQAYLAQNDPSVNAETLSKAKEQAWELPTQAREVLETCRRECGPPPLNQLDPMHFFMTWGEIVKLPPYLATVAWRLASKPASEGEVVSELHFIRRQMNREVAWVYCAAPWGTTGFWERMGIQAIVNHRRGEIDRTTSPMSLPYWELKGCLASENPRTPN